MDLPKDNPRVRELLTQYAVELQNEVPILSRYTDTLTRPDILGGFAEREQYEAWRKNLMCPDDATTLSACVNCLKTFRDCGTVWDELRGALLIDGQTGLAAELKERRERRAADLDRMIAEAEALARLMPSTPEELLQEIAEDCKTARDDDSGYDFISDMTGEAQPPEDFNPPSEATVRYIDLRAWEAAAIRFNHGITGDVDFVEAQIAAMFVSAFANHNDRLLASGGKPSIRAAASIDKPQTPEETLIFLNAEFGDIPAEKFKAMTFEEKTVALGVLIRLASAGNLRKIEDNSEKAARGIDDLAAEMSLWRDWVKELAASKNGKNPAPSLCAPTQAAVVKVWEEFTKGDADPEVKTERDGWRKHKRTFDECLAIHGNDVIWHGRTLKQLTPDKDSFARVIHNAQEKDRQKRAKKKNASIPQIV